MVLTFAVAAEPAEFLPLAGVGRLPVAVDGNGAEDRLDSHHPNGAQVTRLARPWCASLLASVQTTTLRRTLHSLYRGEGFGFLP